ncbi:MAG: O-antigen ligase domain-containing protein [Chitinophagia bacterium]|nr:O-antigen ligase domain-containing protein [Chitinophagia bacterium]
MVETRLSLLLFPLILIYLAPRFGALLTKMLPAFAITCILWAFTGNIIYAIKLLKDTTHQTLIDHVHYRIDIEGITGKHPTYMSMYLIFSMCILLYTPVKKYHLCKYALLFLAMCSLLPLLAKSPLIALVIIILHQAWIRRDKLRQYRWPALAAVVFIALACWKVPFISQRLLEMTAAKQHQTVIDNSVLARQLIFKIDLTALKAYWLTGTGPGRLREVLNSQYLFYSLQYGYDTSNYDPHNEYLYVLATKGLLGMGLYLAIFIQACLIASKRKSTWQRHGMWIFVCLFLVSIFFNSMSIDMVEGHFMMLVFLCFLAPQNLGVSTSSEEKKTSAC